MSIDSKNSSGSQKTNSSQGSSEIEARERTFGSINLQPLLDNQGIQTTEPYQGSIRYKAIRLKNVQDNSSRKYFGSGNQTSDAPSTNKPSGSIKETLKQTRIADYILEKTIGKGNFAVVKLARHNIINSKVAIKIMSKSLLGSENLEKVAREIEAMKRIEHPHVIKLYQVLENESKIFVVMEYAEKGEVFDHISIAHAFTEKDARELFWQVICAIHYCHKSGIVHRDLKAENLLLNANYQIKVADFGFCNFFEKNKLLSTHCGSPQYAAPEVFKGELYDGPLADVWSLGVVLYIMVCGSFPFPGESLGDIRNQVLRGLVRFPFFLSTSCEFLVRGMLQVDPSKRFRIAQIIATPWMLASNNVDKYKSLMEIYDKKAVENKFQEIFHRQHPEHSDIIREQIYHSSKIKIDSAIQMALQMAGYDEDEVRNSVINRSFDKVNAAYHILKDKVCRYFNNPLLKLHLEATHSSIIKDSDANPYTQDNSSDVFNDFGNFNEKSEIEKDDISSEECYKRLLQMPYNFRKNSLSYVKTNFCSNSDITTMGKLYFWVLQSNEELLLSSCQSSLMDENPILQSNVRRHTVQLTEMPNEFRTLSTLATLSPGFPISSSLPKKEDKDEKEREIKTSKADSILRRKQIFLDSTRSQTTSKLNLPPASGSLIKTRNLVDIRHNDSVTFNYSTHPPEHSSVDKVATSKSSVCQLSEIREYRLAMDSDFIVDIDESLTPDNNQQDVTMGSTDSTNWTVMKNLPQLNLPVNLPALVHQPMAKFTIKDPHLLAPPDFMTPYNSCFPRRSSDGAADKQPLHRSNPGVGGSYPEQSAHKYRTENESLYDAVVKQIVPSTKENYINDSSPLEFMGLHLKRFSLPMNGSYNIHNSLYPEDSSFNQYLGSGNRVANLTATPSSYRRGSEDSQMLLWHKQVARGGYIDSGSLRSYKFFSAPSSRGSSPYQIKVRSSSGGPILNRKKTYNYLSVDQLFSKAPLNIHECVSKQQPSLELSSEFQDISKNESPKKYRGDAQQGLDLQELKAELQNLALMTSGKEETGSKLTSKTSSLVIPSISLSPITTKNVTFSLGHVGMEKSLIFNMDSNSIDQNRPNLQQEGLQKYSESISNKNFAGNVDQYKRQMYLHWFPGIIRSTSNLPPEEYTTIQSSRVQKESSSTFESTFLACQDPPPLSYYSPFMRDEDAADLAAIERVNRKVSQVDSHMVKPEKKDTKGYKDSQYNTDCRDINASEYLDNKMDSS